MTHIPFASLSRREWLRLSTGGIIASSLSNWLATLAAATARDPGRRRSCILLWMNGGPSQMDTFDLKPGHANGGPFKEVQTSVPGIRISEHLPRVARCMEHMALIRSMTSREADHSRATFLLRTGYKPEGPIHYPPLGALVSRELGRDDSALPNFVSIMPYRRFSPEAYTPGFLGPMHAPLVLGDNAAPPGQAMTDYEQTFKVKNLRAPREIISSRVDARIGLLDELDRDFAARQPGTAAQTHRAAYDRAVRLMRTAAAKAFDLEQEKATIRDAYGRNLFGQSCLIARRLVERGVPFVEVTLGQLGNNDPGWDTHNDNFTVVRRLSQVLDAAWANLMQDLKARGMFDSTLIVWMGEFGRTPKINENKGRDHFPDAWSTVLAGGGIKGGQVVGRTSADGTAVEHRPVTVPDLLATICHALGIDPLKQNLSNVGRPIRIVDKSAKPLQEILA